MHDIDSLCEGVTDEVEQAACGQLKMDVVASLQAEVGAPPEQASWGEARAWVKSQEDKGLSVFAVVQRWALVDWKKRTQQLADAQLRAHVLAQIQALTPGLPKGDVLQLVHASPIGTEGQANADGLHSWRALKFWASTPLLHQVHLTGVVTGAAQAEGRTTWVIDAQFKPEQVWRSALRCAAMLLGLVLLGWHLPAWVLALRRDERQLKAIVDHWTRLDSGAAADATEPPVWRKQA